MRTFHHHGPDYDLDEIADDMLEIDRQFGEIFFGSPSDMYISKERVVYEESTAKSLEFDETDEHLRQVFVRTGNLEVSFYADHAEVDRQHANKGLDSDRAKAVLEYVQEQYPEDAPYDEAVDEIFEDPDPVPEQV